MADYDLIVRNARIVTEDRQIEGDIAVKDGRFAAIEPDVKGTASREIDAGNKFVLPGGIDSHVHIEQRSGFGIMCADDFYTGTVSAAFGGTTTVIPFAAQHRGMSLRQVVQDYHAAATPKAVIDYAFHLIVTDPTPQALGQDLPALIKDGYTSFKIYMTYDAMKVSDYQLLDILALARREGALVMVHAENHDMIQWLAHHLVEQGHGAPKFHAIAHARIAEAEATNRAISLARLVDAPMLIVHMSEIEALETLRQAQKKGLKIFGETCPQYIALTADDMDKPGVEGAMWCCSPPPRDSAAQEAVWAALKDGTLQTFSSDHAPYQFNEKGKIPKGDKTTFKEMANGVPGLELRLPLLFSEGVQKGRISLQQFVALGSTNHARLYGLYPRKGTITVGSDADFAIWDADRRVTVRWKELLHDNVGYSPYEGREIHGWPVVVVSRGRVVVENGKLDAERGSGQFLPCDSPDSAKPKGMTAPELQSMSRFGLRPLF
jgi:dihydropyrimidinase